MDGSDRREGATDVLEVGRESARGRRLPPAAILGLLIALLAGGQFLDRSQRNREYTQLLTCVRSGQTAATDADTRVAGMSGYISPALNAGPTPQIRDGLYAMVARAASAALPELQRASTMCRAVPVAFWHGSIRAARRAYLAGLDARVSLTRAVASDGALAATDRSALHALRTTAQARLLAAAPDAASAHRARAALGP